jgi:hypothetical protein
MADLDLQSIEKSLQDRARQLERERLAAHEEAMKEIAASKTEEAKRRQAAQELIDAQKVLREKQKAAQAAAAAEAATQERQLQVLMEQEQNRRQSEIDASVARIEATAKRLSELEHAEEIAKKELRDLILNNTERPDTERIVPNPLERFFQTEPR